jgi:thiamine pyrophosphokinase
VTGPAAVLRADEPVTLAGGSRITPYDLDACLAVGRRLVAADSGADRLLALGQRPESVIGDMDSIGVKVQALLGDRLHPVDEQDSTDFEKCLIRIDAPLVLALGFAGGRLDHTLSVLNTLVRHPGRRCVVLGGEDVAVLAPPEIGLPLDGGERVSLFPLAGVQGRSSGLQWPIDGIDFAPGGVIGTSNRAIGPVHLSLTGPGMVLILPRRCLPELLAGLDEAPRWR